MVALFFIRFPQIVNLWEEEETQPLHLLQGNLIMDCRFRRSRAVSFLRSICRKRVQNYCFFFIPTRRHKKVAYLPKSRNCVNTAQTPLQKNAIIFIFFATPSGLSSFFAFWGFLFRLWCSPPLCFVDYFVSLTACCHGSRPCLFSLRFLLSGLRCRQITAALSSLSKRTVRPSRPMIFSCIRSSLADRKYRPAREVSMRV